MARKRRRNLSNDAGELNMTAMIDVVFQLLIFFLVTQKPIDTMANLDVFRPSQQQPKNEMEQMPNMIRIQIFPDGIAINNRAVGFPELDALLGKLAGIDKNQTVLVMCAPQSLHENLIRVLDLCAKTGLVNLSVISTN